MRKPWKQGNPCEKKIMSQQVWKGKSKTWRSGRSGGQAQTPTAKRRQEEHRVSDISYQSETQEIVSSESKAMSQESEMELPNQE